MEGDTDVEVQVLEEELPVEEEDEVAVVERLVEDEVAVVERLVEDDEADPDPGPQSPVST